MSVDESLLECTSQSVGLFWVYAADDPDFGDRLWAANSSAALVRGTEWLSSEGELCVKELMSASQADLLRSSIEALIVRHGAAESARLILELVCESMVNTLLKQGREIDPVPLDGWDHE